MMTRSNTWWLRDHDPTELVGLIIHCKNHPFVRTQKGSGVLPDLEPNIWHVIIPDDLLRDVAGKILWSLNPCLTLCFKKAMLGS